LVTMADIRKMEEQCHLAKDFDEMNECYLNMNEMIKQYLTEKFGYKGRTCNERDFDRKKLGVFVYDTLKSMGLDLDDITDIELDCREGVRNVFALTIKPENKKIWFKASGSNRDLTVDEIIFTEEIEKIGKLIGEDVPTVLNSDLNNRVMALSEVTGRPIVRESVSYTDLSPTEVATNALFEIILMDADRVRYNVLREDGIIKEIDFAALVPSIKSLDEFIYSKVSNPILKGVFNTLKRMAGNPEYSTHKDWMLKFKEAMLEKIDEYYEKEHYIKLVAPHIYEFRHEDVDNILTEIKELLQKIK